MKLQVKIVPLAILMAFILTLAGCKTNNQLNKDIINAVTKNPIFEEQNGNKTDTIIIEQMQFIPAELTIQKGDTVVWINKGIVEHDISDFPDKTWTSGTLKIGESWKKVPTESFDYFCSIHMTMKGSIKVID